MRYPSFTHLPSILADVRCHLERATGRQRRDRSEFDRQETIAELAVALNCSRPMLAAIEAAADEIAKGAPYDAVDVLEACETLATYDADPPEIIESIEAVVDLAITAGEAPEAVAEYAGEASRIYDESYAYVCEAARRELTDAPVTLDGLWQDVIASD